jgi:hypothetical protein
VAEVGEVAYVSRDKKKRMKYKVKVEKDKGLIDTDFAVVCVWCLSLLAACPRGVWRSRSFRIRAVERGWRKIGADDVAIDSAAEESVCPRDWARAFGKKDAGRKLKFISASGGEVGHYASFRTCGESAVMSLTSQVSDVKKPLAAARKISEKGNKVVFGPRAEGNYIENVATGRRTQIIKKSCSHVVPAELIMKEAGFTGHAC